MELTRYFYDAYLHKTIAWKGVPILKAFIEMEHPRDAAGRFTAGSVGEAAAKDTEAKEKGHAVTKDLSLLASLLQTGKSATVHHAELGAITVDAGEPKKKSFGVKHIISQRFREGKNEEEITALLYLVTQTLQDGKARLQSSFANVDGSTTKHYEIEKNGILTYVSNKRFGKDEQFLLTGFDSVEKNKEATDAIQTVIANYSYLPEYSGIRKQVGAVIASLGSSSSKGSEKSSIEKLKKSLAAFEATRNNANLEKTMSDIRWKLIKWQLEKNVYHG